LTSVSIAMNTGYREQGYGLQVTGCRHPDFSRVVA